MKLYNPTMDRIEDMYIGKIYQFEPEQVKHVADDAGLHFIRRNSVYGLVALDIPAQHLDDENFDEKEWKKTQREVGLRAYKSRMEQCLNQEQMFPREVTHKNGGEVELATTQVPHFKKKIKEIEEALGKTDDETKKVGRPRKINVNESATTN